MSGLLAVITAPSGAGKTSLIGAFLRNNPKWELSISYTTRLPREGEKEGKDYCFVSENEFLNMAKEQFFLESARVHGAWYGTAKKTVEEALQLKKNLLLELDWQGAKHIQKNYLNAVMIFILPPSLQALEDRLRRRAKDSESVIQQRLQSAQNEVSHVNDFEYVIINADFDVALADLSTILNAQFLKRDQQINLDQHQLSGLLSWDARPT